MTEEELKALLGERYQPRSEAGELPPAHPAEPLPEEPVLREDTLPEEQPVPAVPGRPAPPLADLFAEQTPADPFGSVPPPPRPVPPESDELFAESAAAAAAPKPVRHVFLYLLLTLLVLAVIGFAVFCIIWDIRTGTSSGGSQSGNIVRVELVQHGRPSEPDTEADENGKYTFAGIAKAVMPSIVEIYTYSDGEMAGAGSGIILSEDGYIATNAHVVENTTGYSVKLFGDKQGDSQYDAVLVGHDTKTDLAVLKISAHGLKPAVLGNSDNVNLGEEVCALGNPAGLSGSITTGIISGMNRKVRAKSTNFEMDCIQTDAAISPGNSGGALVNMYGQVIGITSSKYASSIITGGYYEGLGFAITINQAMPIIQELMEKGYVSGRVRIGIQFLDNVNAMQSWKSDEDNKDRKFPKELEGHGVLVVTIADDSDLKNTAMKDGDWILKMNGKEVKDYDSINAAIEGLKGGDSVKCACARILDDGTVEHFDIEFTLLEDQSGDY